MPLPLTFYINHVDIPPMVRDYILTISGESDIMNVPIADINGYFAGAQTDYNAFLEASYLFPIPDGSLEETLND